MIFLLVYAYQKALFSWFGHYYVARPRLQPDPPGSRVPALPDVPSPPPEQCRATLARRAASSARPGFEGPLSIYRCVDATGPRDLEERQA